MVSVWLFVVISFRFRVMFFSASLMVLLLFSMATLLIVSCVFWAVIEIFISLLLVLALQFIKFCSVLLSLIESVIVLLRSVLFDVIDRRYLSLFTLMMFAFTFVFALLMVLRISFNDELVALILMVIGFLSSFC